MKICAVSGVIGEALRELGHEVLLLWPRDERIFDLPQALEKHSFSPDLVFQQESLGPRILLQGLEHIPCPKIFWSIDTHLNTFWHKHYIELFDGVMTPHVSLLDAHTLRRPVGRLAQFGVRRDFVPFRQRDVEVTFVGRITEHRFSRRYLAEMLTAFFNGRLEEDIPFEAMLDLYDRTKLVPNEAIMSEVNFRLVEAASCGALVLSPDVGPDQDTLFLPGKEIIIFDDGLELKDLMDFYLARPDTAEAVAHKAWERVQKNHLVEHRARGVLEFSQALSSSAAVGSEAEFHWLNSLLYLVLADRLIYPVDEIELRLTRLEPTPPVLSALLRLWNFRADKESIIGLVVPLLQRKEHPQDLELNSLCSAACILYNELHFAKQLWFRYAEAASLAGAENPKTPAALCTAWADAYRRQGILIRPGFPYDPLKGLPESALDFLLFAESHEPENLRIQREYDAVLSRVKGFDYMRLGRLSTLTLHHRNDWRRGLELGMLNFKLFRLAQGLEEILLAQETARRLGKEKSFERSLAALDTKGRIRLRLQNVE